jgi:hypothetical protein
MDAGFSCPNLQYRKQKQQRFAPPSQLHSKGADARWQTCISPLLEELQVLNSNPALCQHKNFMPYLNLMYSAA